MEQCRGGFLLHVLHWQITSLAIFTTCNTSTLWLLFSLWCWDSLQEMLINGMCVEQCHLNKVNCHFCCPFIGFPCRSEVPYNCTISLYTTYVFVVVKNQCKLYFWFTRFFNVWLYLLGGWWRQGRFLFCLGTVSSVDFHHVEKHDLQ